MADGEGSAMSAMSMPVTLAGPDCRVLSEPDLLTSRADRLDATVKRIVPTETVTGDRCAIPQQVALRYELRPLVYVMERLDEHPHEFVVAPAVPVRVGRAVRTSTAHQSCGQWCR